MRALVLAAGEGRRLRPLTDRLPKPMVSVAGRPILAHNIERLVAAGVRDVTINLHHSGDAIVEYFGNGDAFGARINYSYEPTLLGTAGAAGHIRDILRDDDFLVVYGDNLSTIDLRQLVGVHTAHGAALTMALYERDDTSASGIAAVDPHGRIRRFVERPSESDRFSNLVNAGYYVVAPSVLDIIPVGRPSDFARDIVPEVIARDLPVWGYRMTERLWWVDSLSDYERTCREFGAE